MVFLVYCFFSKIRELYIIARVKAAGNKTTKSDFGGVYYGQWKCCRELHGTYKEGGQEHGYGTYTGATGYKYVGGWKNGEKHGNGIFTSADGGKYVGGYENGQRNGQGTGTNPDGTIDHSGKWVNGNPVNDHSKFFGIR